MMQKAVAVSPELLKLRRKRNVLIRGAYDTFAERFAKENKFDFLHCGISLAEYDIETAHEHDLGHGLKDCKNIKRRKKK